MNDSGAPVEFVPPSTRRLCVIRRGHQVVRQWHIPKPVVLVDTREQMPWCLLDNHPNWIGGERRVALAAGDYSVEGMQAVLALERKSMPDALDAIEAKFGIPVLYTSRVRDLAEERAASWLSKHFTYWKLEEHGHGRVLIDEDGL